MRQGIKSLPPIWKRAKYLKERKRYCGNAATAGIYTKEPRHRWSAPPVSIPRPTSSCLLKTIKQTVNPAAASSKTEEYPDLTAHPSMNDNKDSKRQILGLAVFVCPVPLFLPVVPVYIPLINIYKPHALFIIIMPGGQRGCADKFCAKFFTGMPDSSICIVARNYDFVHPMCPDNR